MTTNILRQKRLLHKIGQVYFFLDKIKGGISFHSDFINIKKKLKKTDNFCQHWTKWLLVNC